MTRLRGLGGAEPVLRASVMLRLLQALYPPNYRTDELYNGQIGALTTSFARIHGYSPADILNLCCMSEPVEDVLCTDTHWHLLLD